MVPRLIRWIGRGPFPCGQICRVFAACRGLDNLQCDFDQVSGRTTLDDGLQLVDARKDVTLCTARQKGTF